MTTKFPLGVYVGNPNGNDPAAQADFEAQYNSFVATMGGAKPVSMNAFTDFSQAPSSWPGSAGWSAWSWNKAGITGATVTPLVGVPMSDSKHWAGNAPGMTNVDFFKDITRGTYDAAYTGIVDAWANAGFKTMDLRLGWEMNGDFMPWFYGNDAASQAEWVKAFQHLSTLLHAEGGKVGATVNIVWNPNLANNGTLPVVNSYPGDAYVDQIAVDAYSPIYPYDLYDWRLNNGTKDATLQQWLADPVNRQHFWSYPSANQNNPTGTGIGFGMEDAIAFAKAHNKPLGIAESGAGGNGTTTGPVDDPAFPQWLAGELAKAQSMGISVPYVNIWDVSLADGDWNFNASSGKPAEAAAWGQYFGAASGGASPAVTVAASLVVNVSEDAWQGDAQFTIAVDGVQQGGVRTATAAHAAGKTQAFSVSGAWTGAHTVSVTFLNDGWGGNTSADRNLYVDSMVLNGVANPAAAGTLGTNGTTAFAVTDTNPAPAPAPAPAPTPAPAPVQPNGLVLHISQDAWQGNAQYTVSVDGVQVGGVRTASASHAAGQSEAVAIAGTWTGAHAVAVTFLNDAWGGNSGMDRNLFVDSIDLNGVANAGARATMGTNGTTSLNVSDGRGGAGLVLQMSEDAWQGDALFTVSVDGVQQGGVRTVTASHAAGQTQAVLVDGSFTPGSHSVSVNFLNDAWGGNAATDRNLYVDRIDLGGVANQGAFAALGVNGPITLTATTDPAAAASAAAVAQQTLVLHLAQDVYGEDAKFLVSIDGKALGGVASVHAAHGSASQAYSFTGTFGVGPHDVAVTFLNDAWGGTTTTDRNLYLTGAELNGHSYAGATAALFSAGTQHVTIGVGDRL